MANEIAALVVKLEAQTSQYMAKLEAAQRKNENFQRRATQSFSAVGTAFKSMIGTLSVGVAVRAFQALIDKMDRLQETARTANLNTDAWQAWSLEAQKAGVSSEKFASAMQRANKMIGDAAGGKNRAASKFFFDLGISLEAVGGGARANEDVLRDFADVLAGTSSSARRASLEAQLFGRSIGPQLDPLLQQGAAGLDDITAKAKKLGLVVSKETLAAADKFNDTLATLATVTFAQFANAVAPILPKLTSLAEKFGTVTTKMIEFSGQLSAFRTAQTSNPFEILAQSTISALENVLNPLNAAIKLFKTAKGLVSDDDAIGKQGDGPLDLTGLTGPKSVDVAAPARDAFADNAAEIKRGKDRMEDALFDMNATIRESLKQDSGIVVNAWGSTYDALVKQNAKMAKDSESSFERMSVAAEQAARNMQDTLGEFLFDPFKDGLSGMLTGLVDVLRQMVAQMAAADLFGALAGIGGGQGGFLGSIGSFFGQAAHRATGGGVAAGMPYWVGERGPELMIPDHSGRIVPNGGGGIVINQSIVAHPGTSPQDLHAVMIAGRNSAIAEIDKRNRQRGRR